MNKSIAVLPFVNMSSDKENEYFSDGMTEEIINALAKIKDLKVTSRTSSFFFKNKNLPIRDIGNELGVAIILEGSIRLSGELIRVTAQLIDVEEDFHFWSETFDRSIKDIFAVQDEISLFIADRLREHIGHFDIEDHLVDVLDISVNSYKLYLKAKFHLMKLTLPETEKAISIFKDLIEEEEQFTLAYLGVNQAFAFLGTMGLMPAQDAFMQAKPFLDKALELDPNLPESQLNMAWISCYQNWDLKKAYEHVNQAIAIRPTDEMYLSLANFLTVEGKLDDAAVYLDKALEIAPLSAMNVHYKGFLYYLKEEYELAIHWLFRSLDLKTDLPFPPLYIGISYVLSGSPEKGLVYFQSLTNNNAADLTKLGGTTLAYAALNNDKEVAIGMNQLESHLESESMGAALNFLILINAILKQYEAVFRLIEQGISYRLPMMLLLYTEPVLKPLHQHKKFQTLMRNALGAATKFQAEKRKYKKTLFSKDELNRYILQLESIMSNEKPFLDQDLTLRHLAESLELPPNYVSQLLNEGLEKNFSEYINSLRLEAFKEKVQDPSQKHLTILALAYDSGFNSKTVFNTFFKKNMGITPKAYWNQVRAI
ncbi:helix-turn-helix domain-containing protein [Lutimonas halocynthiae]|uniref:helix-turn-helix domain-containing protein n=1 Tax=Lutimonas halocynthiae TaxID=1446477 RepID=UPI0025B54623|nr:helix-turn-helix domain-containing protein [Lutimonas halocynthiae]MDN3644032.1 helix-turn-helix domain-containing protein [Lutimonas halocynthiae]